MKYENMRSEKYVDSRQHFTAMIKNCNAKANVHFHEFFELEIILEGSGIQMLNGDEYKLKRGSVYLLTPADFHSVTSDSEMKLVNIMFDESLFSKSLLSALFGKGRALCFEFSEKETAELVTLAQLLISESESDDSYSSLAASDILDLLLIKILRKSESDTVPANGGKDSMMTDIMRYLYLHFRDDPSLVSMASVCGYSPNYFSKLFSELTGKGYSQFLNDMKVTHAKMLLVSTNKAVSEIASFCGFSSLSNFYRVFKEYTSLSPTEYREIAGRCGKYALFDE